MKWPHAQSVSTGASFAQGLLYIATIGHDREGRLRLVKSKSTEVRLVDRRQVSLQAFAQHLLGFLQVNQITQLTFVYSPAAGSHMAHFGSYKSEAVLQLMPVKVELLHASQIDNVARTADSLPGSDRARLGAAGAKCQSRAIVAAYHGLQHRRDGEQGAAMLRNAAIASGEGRNAVVPAGPLSDYELISLL